MLRKHATTHIAISLFLMVLIGALFALVACGDDDDDNDNDADDDDVTDDDATDDDATDDDDGDDDAADDDAADDDDDVPATCGEFSFNIHSSATGWVYLVLADMSFVYVESDAYDFKIGHLAKAEDIDYILLGPGAEALNLGDADAFADVTEVPADGYAMDEGDQYVIGTGWQVGGSCPSGWDMSGNVYALHLADGTYAKIAVTSAQAGSFTISGFRQADGMRDVDCAMPE